MVAFLKKVTESAWLLGQIQKSHLNSAASQKLE